MADKIEIKKSVCVWCKSNCGVLVHVRDGHLVKVTPDPEWPSKITPSANGCPRLRAAKEFFYHPDRLNFVLKRAGDRGEGKWQRITWEQALDEIAAKLKDIKEEYGAEAVSYTSGTMYRTEHGIRERFFNLFGSPNYHSGISICFGPRSMMGDTIIGQYPHFTVKPSTKCIVCLGSEPLGSRLGVAKIIKDARKLGAKLIVIDPARTRSASMADVWLQLRPGTDCALLMAMINVIINEGLYQKEFVEKWCYGFEKLKERAEEYPPQKVQDITMVPAEKIIEAARMYATNRPGTFIEGMGVEQSSNSSETLHARWILAALAGNIDVEGGEEQSEGYSGIVSMQELKLYDMLSPEQRRKQIGADRFKLMAYTGQGLVAASTKKAWDRPGGLSAGGFGTAHQPLVCQAILSSKPYPVRAMFSDTHNTLVCEPNTKLVYKALKSLDLHVVLEQWMTPTAEIADYVIPVACWLERPILWDGLGYGQFVMSGEAALPTTVPGECDRRLDYDIWRGLGLRLGQEKYWPWENLEQYYDYKLKPLGLSHKNFVHQVRIDRQPSEFKKYEKRGFGTPTGKVELYSTILEELGYDPLPRYREPAESPVSQPELAKEYPLTLMTGRRSREYYHSEWRQIDSVRKQHPNPLLEIHPDTARKLGISEGDWVWIESPRGRIRHKAKFFDGMAPDIVHAEHCWWLPELPGVEPWLHGLWEVNVNVLTDDDPEICNPILGSWPLRTLLVKVYKAEEYL